METIPSSGLNGQKCVRKWRFFALLISGLSLWAVFVSEASAAGEKRVIIDQTSQILRAYEGDRLVLESPISTGKNHRTPNGTFRVGYKSRMHYSSLYDDAPMPYSVQINGNIFIHGFTYVPSWPASHGCIRVPVRGWNPARIFFYWVDPGTTVIVKGRWKGGSGQ